MYLPLKDDGLATLADIAKTYGISKNHLTKIAYELDVAGYVETVRGRRGGLRLAKPTDKIGLGDIVRLTEPDLALVPCFKPGDASCVIVKCCALKTVLNKARSAFVDVIDGYRLSDLVKPHRQMRSLLSLQPHDGGAVL
jgi:Rrf2 family nitric oxide-sensitive transcriptional repressor